MTRILRLIPDERGATAIEYGLIVALIAMATIGGMNLVAGETISMWNNVSTTLDTAIED